MSKLKVPVAAFGLKLFVVSAVVLWLVGTAAGYAGQALDIWALNLTAIIARGLLALLVLWAVWGLLARVIQFVAERILETEDVEIDLPGKGKGKGEEMQQIEQTVGGLARILADVEQDSSKASTLLCDAEKYTETLVALIKAIVLKAQTMRAEVFQLQAASEAIASGDLMQIAQAAGNVKDSHIRSLMLCNMPAGGGYWIDLTRMVSAQLGTLEQWSANYDTFASHLVNEVAAQKTRLTALSASLELAGTARPLLGIQANLDEAQYYLQPQRRPELAQSLKSLPPVNSGLLQ